MATYVLVHGANFGGWSWRQVGSLLQAAGHTVYAPTLTGLGERSHLATREIGLSTHIQDIGNVLYYEDLQDVILVGKSYAGLVVTGVADRIPERLRHVVYADAIWPRNGECGAEVGGLGGKAQMEEIARARGEGWRLVLGPAVNPRYSTPLLRMFVEPLQLTHPDATPLTRTFIRCVDTPLPAIIESAKRARATEGVRFAELPTGHEPEFTMPDGFADLLLEVATL